MTPVLDPRTEKYIRLRSGLERIFALAGLVLLAPLFVAIAVGLLVSMGRPVLFRQVRVGRYGYAFTLLKFRTMVSEAERIGGGYMPEGMDLITPFGKFLRRTSLDELPQLINVLRGDMSLVGPRPALTSQYERYSDKQATRVAVPPGVTGLAQVRVRNAAPWSVRIEHDLEYVRTVSARIDLSILFKTASRAADASGVLFHQTADEVDDLGSETLRKVNYGKRRKG